MITPQRLIMFWDIKRTTAARKAITIDLSATGLCMYILDPLPQGQKIIIKTALPVDSRIAVICWTRKEENSLYRSGLKFV